jgi:cellobiose phosphorylase
MMQSNLATGWRFINKNGEFELDNPQQTSYLYFPLANEAGMMSAITPLLHGDIKSTHNTFLMSPVSVEDLHNSRSARNFWIYSDTFGVWSATGNSPAQLVQNFSADSTEKVKMTGGFLWHQVSRENSKLGLKAEITNFVPVTAAKIELMKVKITNIGIKELKITPTAAIPIYGRSADNIRDHHHVTSLLHRISVTQNGIEVQPTLSFDECGHRVNRVAYGVLGAEGDGAAPLGFFPLIEEYIGEGGTLEWPEAVVKNVNNYYQSGIKLEGFEAIGGLRFQDTALQPGQYRSYIIAMVISDNGNGFSALASDYCSEIKFDMYLKQNQEFWEEKLNRLQFNTGNDDFNQWLKWVTLQPILRRIYGCSFLPHHDYGRGGRGWRDLWQDCLALLVMDPATVSDLLFNNYAGVRIDGSNATIIGSKPGEFSADRNNISRVWMDHGAWPFLTTLLYLNQSGDLEFLLKEQTYFKDRQLKRSKDIDLEWKPGDGNQLKQQNGVIYRGTILEHILLQNLVQFFNVGDHNNIKLEDADWNDGLDMAPAQGESAAFTAFYGGNLLEINNLLLELPKKTGIKEVELASEILTLLDSFSEKVDYNSISQKRNLLDTYFESCRHTVSGTKIKVPLAALAADLANKGNWIAEHLRAEEWLTNAAGYSWFNGYYNNDGERVEGDHPSGTRMTLTGQVFAIMNDIATHEQVAEVVRAVNHYLNDPKIGGYRLNTNFGGIQLNLGRCFAYAFGHKENGAIFSHMAIMYGNALYKRGFVKEGYQVFNSLYQLSRNFEKSRIYPGIPEYINEKGRGMYHYLTGSASWILLTMLTEVFGVKGKLGDLMLEPKLIRAQFDSSGTASVATIFADRRLNIVYQNKSFRDYGQYKIKAVTIDGKPAENTGTDQFALISRSKISGLNGKNTHQVVVELGSL